MPLSLYVSPDLVFFLLPFPVSLCVCVSLSLSLSLFCSPPPHCPLLLCTFFPLLSLSVFVCPSLSTSLSLSLFVSRFWPSLSHFRAFSGSLSLYLSLSLFPVTSFSLSICSAYSLCCFIMFSLLLALSLFSFSKDPECSQEERQQIKYKSMRERER